MIDSAVSISLTHFWLISVSVIIACITVATRYAVSAFSSAAAFLPRDSADDSPVEPERDLEVGTTAIEPLPSPQHCGDEDDNDTNGTVLADITEVATLQTMNAPVVLNAKVPKTQILAGNTGNDGNSDSVENEDNNIDYESDCGCDIGCECEPQLVWEYDSDCGCYAGCGCEMKPVNEYNSDSECDTDCECAWCTFLAPYFDSNCACDIECECEPDVVFNDGAPDCACHACATSSACVLGMPAASRTTPSGCRSRAWSR